jgi:hypothetical protein
MPVFTRAAVLGNRFPQARGGWARGSLPKEEYTGRPVPGRYKLAAPTQIFRAQVEELAAKGLLDHSGIDTGVGTLSA